MNDGVVEAILFAAGRPISTKRICELSGLTGDEVLRTIDSLQNKYAETTFDLIQIGNDWKFTVKKQYLPIVEKIAPDTELTRSVIETLAILAWKSPMLQSDLIKIRSTKAYDHLHELKDKGWIAKEKQGRSYVLKLTPKFFEYFDIEGQEAIQKMIDESQVQDKVEETIAREKAQEEIRLQKMQEELEEEGPSLDEIKEKEKASAKDFLDAFDKSLEDVTSKTKFVTQEIEEFKPKEETLEEEKKE